VTEHYGESLWAHITAIAFGAFLLGITIGAIVLNEASLYEGLRDWQIFIASVIAMFAAYFFWRGVKAGVTAVQEERQKMLTETIQPKPASADPRFGELIAMATERRSALNVLLDEISEKKSFSLDVLRATRQSPLEFLPGHAPEMSLKSQSALLAAGRSLQTYGQLLENLTVTKTGPDGSRLPTSQDDINRVGPLASRCAEKLDALIEAIKAELAEVRS